MEDLVFVKEKKIKKVKCLLCRRNYFAHESECPYCGYDNADGAVCSCGSREPKKFCCENMDVWLGIDNELIRIDGPFGAEVEGITRIYVEEEYGYRHWMWYFKGTIENFMQWWNDLPSVQGFFYSARLLGELGLGEIKEVHWELVQNVPLTKRAPIHMHIHEDDDSWVSIYADKWTGQRNFTFVLKKIIMEVTNERFCLQSN